MQEFKHWLQSLLDLLSEKQPLDTKHNLAAAIFILLCCGLIYSDFHCLKKVFVEHLTRMLTLNPDPESKSCPDYDFLLSLLSPQTRYLKVRVAFLWYTTTMTI